MCGEADLAAGIGVMMSAKCDNALRATHVFSRTGLDDLANNTGSCTQYYCRCPKSERTDNACPGIPKPLWHHRGLVAHNVTHRSQSCSPRYPFEAGRDCTSGAEEERWGEFSHPPDLPATAALVVDTYCAVEDQPCCTAETVCLAPPCRLCNTVVQPDSAAACALDIRCEPMWEA